MGFAWPDLLLEYNQGLNYYQVMSNLDRHNGSVIVLMVHLLGYVFQTKQKK